MATFTVGGLSIINAIAGAYSEDLPVICITGGQQRTCDVTFTDGAVLGVVLRATLASTYF